jgi:ATP-dependent Clp endopeptidase proteolytic subunit ClpP
MDLKELTKKSGVDGEIWVTEFTIEAALEFREDVLEASKGDPTRPITVYINSYGGAVDALASMVETMDEIPNPIITVAHGTAMSCGAILLSHGDIRFCGVHARIMVHEVSSATHGDVHDMAADAQETKRLNKYFIGLLAKNCGIKGGYESLRKRIKNQDGRDHYMDAATALKFGIVDCVGMPKLNRMKLFQVEVTPAKAKITKNTPDKKSKGKK